MLNSDNELKLHGLNELGKNEVLIFKILKNLDFLFNKLLTCPDEKGWHEKTHLIILNANFFVNNGVIVLHNIFKR